MSVQYFLPVLALKTFPTNAPRISVLAGTWDDALLTLTVTNPANAFADVGAGVLAGSIFIVTGGTGALTGAYVIDFNGPDSITLTGSIGAPADTQIDITGYIMNSTLDYSASMFTARSVARLHAVSVLDFDAAAIRSFQIVDSANKTLIDMQDVAALGYTDRTFPFHGLEIQGGFGISVSNTGLKIMAIFEHLPRLI